jgi:glutamate mutase epsilon subunit
MSGHADILHADGVSGVPLLAKPFKVAELKRRITETLQAPSSDFRAGTPDAQLLAATS